MDGNFPHEVGSPFGYRRTYAVDDLDGAAVDIDRDEYPADCEQQSEPGRPYHRTEPVGRGDARLSAESRAEDAPACAEKIAERERAEYHDDERRPYRTVQEERPDAHDAQRENEQYNGNAYGEDTEPLADECRAGDCSQLARMVGDVVHRAPTESFAQGGLVFAPGEVVADDGEQEEERHEQEQESVYPAFRFSYFPACEQPGGCSGTFRFRLFLFCHGAAFLLFGQR